MSTKKTPAKVTTKAVLTLPVTTLKSAIKKTPDAAKAKRIDLTLLAPDGTPVVVVPVPKSAFQRLLDYFGGAA